MSEVGTGPLAGLLVVSVEQAVAAPFATSRLADAGARVIKVERPEGDFARAYDHVVDGECAWFVWLNRGKESVVLDFKEAGDAALLHRMIARADVFVQNLAPGATGRAGFDSGQLRQRHPRLASYSYGGEQFTVLSVISDESGDKIVRAQVARPSGADPVGLDFRVRSKDGIQKVIDLYVEGIGMLHTHRAEFSAVVNRKGIDGLLSDLRALVEAPVGDADAAE